MSNSILIAGCGGGYDIFTGLPLYFKLTNEGHTVHLLSFALSSRTGKALDPAVTGVCRLNPIHPLAAQASNKDEKDGICCEQLLANEIKEPVYCIEDVGLRQFSKSYESLVRQLKIDTIYLCDGGCDSIMFGNEKGLGTPVEDMMSMWTVKQLVVNKVVESAYLVCLGVTVDTFEDILYSDLTANLKTLDDRKALLSTESLQRSSHYVQKYVDVFKKCAPQRSIVNCSIVAGLMGEYGKKKPELLGDRVRYWNHEITPRVHEQYTFDLLKVCESILYLEEMAKLDDSDEINDFIDRFQSGQRSCS